MELIRDLNPKHSYVKKWVLETKARSRASGETKD